MHLARELVVISVSFIYFNILNDYISIIKLLIKYIHQLMFKCLELLIQLFFFKDFFFFL